MDAEKGLKLYENLPRDQYFRKNQELSNKLWETEQIPTVYDIAQFMKGEDNQKMDSIFDFFDNKEEFTKMANRTHQKYDEEESAEFIRKVMSANSSEISEAGYFYKLLMASADDFRIIENDCRSNGAELDLNDIDEDFYNYHIRSMFVNELGKNSTYNFDKFKEEMLNNEKVKRNNGKIHLRNPLTCNCRKNHGICRRCSGDLPENITNIGAFTALCVTEHVTQSCLSSMNKGVKENINNILLLKYEGDYEWEPIEAWIKTIVERLKNDKVQARYYEIALLSRVRYDGDFGPFVASMKSSINYSGNVFGEYIFNPNMKTFSKIIRKKSFEDNSLKLKIAMNSFEE